MKQDADLKYWLGLSLVEGLGPKIFQSLYAHFGSSQAIWEARGRELSDLGLSEKAVESLAEIKETKDLEEELERVERLGIRLIRSIDKEYPENLKKISSPPFLLYAKGEILPQDVLSLAVVGTRKFSDYGKRATTKIVGDLASSGLTIVSGLALGIDSFAHQAALEVGGRTIAVLGHGLDQVYPSENRELAWEVSCRGALISEFPLGFPPVSGNFPARNRIIAGLSLGTLVCEAPEKSGALITASCALEAGRPVFALSGPIFSPQSVGTARLIQEGAKLVINVSDILSELDLRERSLHVEARKIIPETEEEGIILKALGDESVHIDEICVKSGLSISLVSSTLTAMEIKGMVEEFANGRWAVRK